MGEVPAYLAKPCPSWYDRWAWHVLDIETTNIDYGDPWNDTNRVVTASMAGDANHVLSDPYRDSGDDLKALFSKHFPSNGRGVLVAHNAKFELGWLYRSGVDITNVLVWDTMIGEYVLAGNRRVALDLGSCARRYGLPGKEPFIDSLLAGGVCPSDMPRGLLEARCRRDTETTLQIARAQFRKLGALGLLPVMFTRCITTPVLTLIEAEGMTLDPERVNLELGKQRNLKMRLEADLALISGGINLGSGKQLAGLLYGKLGFPAPKRRDGSLLVTKHGWAKTDKTTLSKLRATTKVQREFIRSHAEYSKASASLSKALEFFDEVCTHRGNKFYGKFNQCVTQTHRLSSSGRPLKCADGKKRGVQFQNLAREYKKLFRAVRPGSVLVETDGAQLEFRVAGHLGRDVQVRLDVATGADIHRFTASVFNHCDEKDVTDKQRTAAKAETFGPLYGRTHGSQKQLEYIEAFQNKYKGVNTAQRGWVTEVLKTQELRTATGLRFYFPGTKVLHNGDITNRTNIFNYPIQSFATADIIPISLVYTFWRTRGYAKIVNTVHDSVVAEVREKDVDRYVETSISCWGSDTYRYLKDVYGIEMFVPLGMGVKVAPHWGDTKIEQKFTLE